MTGGRVHRGLAQGMCVHVHVHACLHNTHLVTAAPVLYFMVSKLCEVVVGTVGAMSIGETLCIKWVLGICLSIHLQSS